MLDSDFSSSSPISPSFRSLSSPPLSSEDEHNVLEPAIGQGTFGKVFRATYVDREGVQRPVAVKKIKANFERGVPLSAIREVNVQSKVRHENVVRLLDQFVVENKKKERMYAYLVYEYAEHVLSEIIKSDVKLNNSCIKLIMYQLLQAVGELHKNYIVHRDIKPANILLDNNGTVKLGDFGLARFFARRKNDYRSYTGTVQTLWYRAPELMFKETWYKSEIDIWSLGCVFAELFRGRPVFDGANEIDQLRKIFSVLGNPKDEDLRRIKSFSFFNVEELLEKTRVEGADDLSGEEVAERMKKRLKEGREVDEETLELILRMLEFNPKKRISVEEAIKHRFFEGIEELKKENFLRLTLSQIKGKNNLKETHKEYFSQNYPKAEKVCVILPNYKLYKGPKEDKGYLLKIAGNEFNEKEEDDKEEEYKCVKMPNKMFEEDINFMEDDIELGDGL